jgi:hypothetical protein
MTATVDTLVDHVRLCSTCRPAFSFDSMCSTGQTIRVGLEVTDRHRTVMVNGLRSNLLVALQRAIEDDPSIPSHRCGAVCNCNLTEWEREIVSSI